MTRCVPAVVLWCLILTLAIGPALSAPATIDLESVDPAPTTTPPSTIVVPVSPSTIVVPTGTAQWVILPEQGRVRLPDGSTLPLVNGGLPPELLRKLGPLLTPELLPLVNGTVPLTNGTLALTNGSLALVPTPAPDPAAPATPPVDPKAPVTPPATAEAKAPRDPRQPPVTPPADPRTLLPTSQPPVAQGPLTVADFLVRSPEKPVDVKPPAPSPRPEAVKPAPKEPTPKDPAPKEPEPAKPDPKNPTKPERKIPVKLPGKKPMPQPDPAAPRKGDPLVIPEKAKAERDLEFLKGCWKGDRPEYNTKRIVTERFCFDDKGSGTRTINDHTYQRFCSGPSRATFNANGSVQVVSDQAPCVPDSDEWGPAEMRCEGKEGKTPCTWMFPGLGGASQSYVIHLVRD